MNAATAAGAGDAAQARAILERAVAAAGGAEALDKITSVQVSGRASAPTHGLEGRAEDRIAAGNRAELIELGAFGKTVMKLRTVTSERRSLIENYDGEQNQPSGKALLAMRFFAVPHPLFRWKERFAAVAAVGEIQVNGEDAVVIELTPRELAPTRLSISTRSFLVLREEIPTYVGDELQSTSNSVDLSGHRVVNGVQMPFSVAITVPLLGRVALTYENVALNSPIDPQVFDQLLP